MKRKMMIMLGALFVLFGLIFTYKLIASLIVHHIANTHVDIFTVSAMKADYSSWQPTIKASGSTRAIRGVNVTTSLAGMVQTIYFTPGSVVQEGTLLVLLNADQEIAQLHALQANLALAKITYNRDNAQYKIQAVSKQQLDSDAANLANLAAEVEAQNALVQKKFIRAPFTGRLGINNVNPGQYVNPGDKIVDLQTLDPLYVDFYLPQQMLANVKVGQKVTVTSDIFPNKTYVGNITTIDPSVDTNSRNVEVEVTISNSNYELYPGMFTSVEVEAGASQKYLTLPQTAVAFNSYGDIVYLVKSDPHTKDKKHPLIVEQAFVTTGPTRGDQISILNGIKQGEMVVTSGQLKLKNGSHVRINNTVQPSNNPFPIIHEDV